MSPPSEFHFVWTKSRRRTPVGRLASAGGNDVIVGGINDDPAAGTAVPRRT